MSDDDDKLELGALIRWASDWRYIAMSPGWADRFLHPHGQGLHQITLFKTLRNARKASAGGGCVLLFVPALLPVIDSDEIYELDDRDEYQFAERQATWWAQRAADLARSAA